MAELTNVHNKLAWESRKRVNAGILLPDHFITNLLEERLKRWDCRPGFVLEGFPRSERQADILDEILKSRKQKLSGVIELTADDQFIKKRVSERRVHELSGRNYYADFNPPKEAGVDDVTGEPLTVRIDDSPEILATRLKTYHEKTKPVIDIYKKRNLWLGAVMIAPNKSADDVFADILKLLDFEKR